MSEGKYIQTSDLPDELQRGNAANMGYTDLQRHWDREIFSEAIRQYGTAREAASALKVSDATVSRKRSSVS